MTAVLPHRGIPTNPLPATSDDKATEQNLRALLRRTAVEPHLSSISFVYDESDKKLHLRLTGGANCISARFEIADNENFTSPLYDVIHGLTEGVSLEVLSTALTPVTDYDKRWYARGVPFTAASGLGDAGVALNDSVYVATAVVLPPPVKGLAIGDEFTRVASTATLTSTIYDPGRRVTDVEFNKRVGDTAPTGWVTSWDSSTGTAGTNTLLVRVEAVGIAEGKDSEISRRVTYTDDAGNVLVDEKTFSTANLEATIVTRRIAGAKFVPLGQGGNWTQTGGYFGTADTSSTFGYAAVDIPDGVEILFFTAVLYRITGAETARATLYRNDSFVAPTAIAVLTHSSTGQQTLTATASENTTGQQYFIEGFFLAPAYPADQAYVLECDLTYEIFTYKG